MKQITLGYFADGPWAHRALEKLLSDASINIAFICARFDRPDNILRDKAAKQRIDWFTHPRINSDEFLERITNYGCDLFVSLSFNQIFQKRLIEYPRLKIINCHAGKLPFYRGRNILNWVLINNEKEFGVTVHYVDEGIDTGDILAQRLFPITDQDDYATLLERAYDGCAELLYETVQNLREGRAISVPQSDTHSLGFYCTARCEGDERLNWNQRSRDVFNFVRAICRPGPEARTYCRDIEIRINRVQLLTEAPIFKGIPGAVLGVDGMDFIVKTADSYVKVIESSGARKIRVGDRLI